MCGGEGGERFSEVKFGEKTGVFFGGNTAACGCMAALALC